jgi:DNA-binding response OmpR family regulator
MKFKILIVEDHEPIAFNLKLLLEMNDYDCLVAMDGQEGLDIMNSELKSPDLILCDIMMPVVNGYEFYEKISAHELWSSIPFIFLSAKSTPQDVRFGKMLGVDDYITKPFVEDDLLSSIKGKLNRSMKFKDFISKYKAKSTELSSIYEDNSKDAIQLDTNNIKKSTYILITMWDDVSGPTIVDIFPNKSNSKISFDQIAQQLYNISVAIYGFHKFTKSEDILMKIANIGMDGFIFFDSISGDHYRGGKSIYMIGVISPHIHHLASQRIRDNLVKLSSKIKDNIKPNLEDYWNEIIKFL